jgi:hypothetical protein
LSKSFSNHQGGGGISSQLGSMTVSNAGGFFTTASSSAFQKQMGRINQNRDLVFANAMQRYRGLLDKGEVAKKNYFEQRKKYIEELERKHEEE